ncbi:hypothetical protein Emed_003372 [Eimeria media]
MAGSGSPPRWRWSPRWRVRSLLFLLLSAFLFSLIPFSSCRAAFGGSSAVTEGPGLRPRRLVVGWTIRKFFLVNTPETLLGERARSLRAMAPGCDYGLQFLYSAVFVAGKHTAARSSLIDTSMEDILVAFFRLAQLDKVVFPLQWYAIENALNRSHERAIQTMLRRQQAEQQDYENDPDREKPLELTVPEYTWLLGQQHRDVEWYFDGNTFHRRGAVSVPERLTEHDLGFMKSLPFNVLRVARGITRAEPTKTVAHLIKELAQRGVTSASDFFLKTNFLDLVFSTSVIEEIYLQLDIIAEYIKNWESYRSGEFSPPLIPLGGGQGNLLETLMSKKSAKEKYPKCPTMKCYVESIWTQRAEHPIDKESNRQQEQEEEKKPPPSEPFAVLQISKTTANALKMVAIGNTGHDTYKKTTGFWGRIKRWFKMNEFEATVEALKNWHQQEHVDVALGLGDFLAAPGINSVRDDAYKTKWHDVFVKEAGLDIPWYMVNGDAEAAITTTAPFRYHYARQDVNFHNPDWLHKAVITMVANLTTADGGSEDQEFTIHVVSIDTWRLFGGPPLYDNLGQYQNNMIALSNTLFHSVKAKADWIIVQGHHPLLSTAPEAEEARFSYINDMVKHGRARGPEHRLVELLTAYQVDAYVSGHDHALEYVTMSDIEKNTTLAFITSGGGTRIQNQTFGRGIFGTIRGKLHPLLCWSSRRIFYKLDPGGCKPSEKDQALAYKFYAPQGPNWKISVKERIMDTTGFASLKITKDFLIVDFVNGRNGKTTGRKLHKQTNREARAVKFIDFWEDADLKLKEMNIDHDAFEEENRERVASEIAFQSRTPILAERLRLYEKELIDMYNEYQQLKARKATYETMNAQKAAALEAQGENLRESELSEGMYEQTERIIELMYIIASDHAYMWEKYEQLKEERKKLPEADNKHAEGLLRLEKKLLEMKRKRREVNKKYVEQNAPPTPADADQIKDYVMKASILKKGIAEFEQTMMNEENGEGKQQETEVNKPEEEANIKPLDMTVEARLERKKQQLEEHEQVMNRINDLPAAEKTKMKAEIDMLGRQRERLQAEVSKLENLLNRKAWAADKRPSELWEKRLQQYDLEQTLKHLEAYKASIINLPLYQRQTKDLSDAVSNIELQKMELEEQLLELKDELYQTHPTQLQIQFLEQMDKLREVSVLVESKGTMPPEVLEDPEVQKSLEEADATLVLLQSEVESLDEAVRKELNIQDEAWVKRMIIRGADVKDLAEEFSLDVNAVLEEDAKARKENPKLQLEWIAQQEWAARQRLTELERALLPDQPEKFAKESEQTQTRLTGLAKLKEEAEAALAAQEAQEKAAAPTDAAPTDAAPSEAAASDAAAAEAAAAEAAAADAATADAAAAEAAAGEEAASEESTAGVPPVASPLPEEKTHFEYSVRSRRPSSDAVQPTTSEEGTTTQELDAADLVDEAPAVSLQPEVSSQLEDKEVLDPEDLMDDEEGGLRRRRLAAIMEWFQPKKEETPVRELPKIDLGPKDPCEGEPMLYVVVKKAINAEYGANLAERCKKVFANRSHRMQRRFIGLFDDSGTPAFYETPHVHVSRTFNSLFKTTRFKAFAKFMREVKERLLDVSSKIGVASFEEAFKPEEVVEGREDADEFAVVDDD